MVVGVGGLCRQSATFHSILNSLYGTLAAHEAHANGRVGVNASRLVALRIVAFPFFFLLFFSFLPGGVPFLRPGESS